MPSVATSLLDLAESVSDREREVAEPFKPMANRATTQPASAPAMSTESPSFASILADLTGTVTDAAPAPTKASVLEPSRPPEPSPLLQPPAIRTPLVRVATEHAASLLRANEQADVERGRRAFGLPALVDPALSDGGAEVTLRSLVGALRELPPLPVLPDDAGDVIAVVGYDAPGAWRSAIRLAEGLGLAEETLTLAAANGTELRLPATRRIESAEAARTRTEKWRRRSTPTIVVVVAPMAAASATWTCDVLEALDPDAIWGVVSATSKTHDASAWVNRLPTCDALVVTDVDASADPASVLEIGPPIAALDGRPATPGAWAGIIVERLLEAA
jgi:hypothetical protein